MQILHHFDIIKPEVSIKYAVDFRCHRFVEVDGYAFILIPTYDICSLLKQHLKFKPNQKWSKRYKYVLLETNVLENLRFSESKFIRFLNTCYPSVI